MEQIIEAKKILVRVPNWGGGVVMATHSFSSAPLRSYGMDKWGEEKNLVQV